MNFDLIIRRKRGEPLSESDYADAKAMILAELESVVEFADIEGDTPEIRKERARIDKSYFARTYLPHYYTTGEAPPHERKIFAALAIVNQPVMITGFRGCGKSTDAMTDELHDMLFGAKQFQVHMMDSLDKAELYTLRILTELQSNKRILHDFGRCVSMEAARGSFESFEPASGKRISRLHAMGMKMSIRGLVSGNTRPDKVTCEDLQNSDTAINPKLTKKLLNKLLADVRFCFDSVRNSWQFRYIGNIICAGSVVDRIIKEAKRWFKLVIPAEYYDKAGRRRATWKQVFPLKKLDEMRADVEIGGDAVYRREMLCQAVELDGEWKESWFRHHNGDLPGFDRSQMIAQIDPSFGDTGDNKAMAIGGIYKLTKESPHFGKAKDAQGKPLDEGEYYVAMELFNRQCSLDSLIKKMYEWDRVYKPAYWRCDGTASQKYFMKRELARYAAMPGYYQLAIKFFDQGENKDEKIDATQPYYEGRWVLFPLRSSKDVEETIIQYTRKGSPGIKRDGPDVIAEWIKSLQKKFGKKKSKVTMF